MNKAHNAWQLTAATLFGLQSVPGLMILYGGSVKKKWAVNSAFMALYAFACVLLYVGFVGDGLISRFSVRGLNGFLAMNGPIDYSGGYVIHLSSGVAGFTTAYWLDGTRNKILSVREYIDDTEDYLVSFIAKIVGLV
ncbi:hypothetical protein L1049_018569 [Liquidambar formosana]|uniref:Ammonium transporter AmtB-like domain-containing protein n=1 Tax=Liquidambar formosana TaxID=63359 RepID=A0AAP0WMF0_LIQFO